MFVTIKYSDLDDLDEVITFDFKHYPNIKIINKSDDSILVEYPDDWSVEDVINMFDRHEELFLFYDSYILTIANELGFEYLKRQIISNGSIYKILSSNSLIINAPQVHYNQLKEIINHNMFSFLLRPYKDTNYIKLSSDLSKFYKTLTTQQNLPLYELGLFSDVEIHVQDHVFKAHKIILAANSQHFFNTFVTYGPETSIIEINDDVN